MSSLTVTEHFRSLRRTSQQRPTMTRFLQRSAPPPEIRNQQVDGSSPFAGSNKCKYNSEIDGVVLGFWHTNTVRVAYRVAYSRILRLLGRSPVHALPLPDDLATEQRVNDLARRLRG